MKGLRLITTSPSATRWVMNAHIAAGSAGSGSNPRSAHHVTHCSHAYW